MNTVDEITPQASMLHLFSSARRYLIGVPITKLSNNLVVGNFNLVCAVGFVDGSYLPAVSKTQLYDLSVNETPPTKYTQVGPQSVTVVYSETPSLSPSSGLFAALLSLQTDDRIDVALVDRSLMTRLHDNELVSTFGKFVVPTRNWFDPTPVSNFQTKMLLDISIDIFAR